MTTSATLTEGSVSLDAGGRAVIPLQIRNEGDVVEGYRLEVVGVPAAWTTVEPEALSVYPGDSTTATVTFAPPRSAAVPAGELPFGVRVQPTEHPDDAVVPEGVVVVLPFLDTTAELVPRSTHGRYGGRHQIAVDNRGNVPLTVTLTGAAGSDDVAVTPAVEALTVSAGHAAFADLRVRPLRRLWRGQPVTHPFSVLVRPQDAQPVTLDGTHVQEAVVPAWWLKALLALLALLLLLVALWLGLKRTAESAAREAVAAPVQQARQDAARAEQQASKAEQQAGSAAAQAQEADGAAGQAQQAAEQARQDAGLEPGGTLRPLSQRLQPANVPAGQESSDSYVVPSGRTLRLTDIVLQNPQGDFGRVRLSLDDQTLLTLALENFRDLDYHFVTPISAAPGQRLQVTVACREVGRPPALTPPPTTCDTAVYLGGMTARPAPSPAR